jgi:hypothetical protein
MTAYNNHSIYNIPYEDHPILHAVQYLYPFELKVTVKHGDEECRCKIEYLEQNKFPSTVDIVCDPVYTFHQCMPDFTPNGDLMDLTEGEVEIRQRLSPILDTDKPTEIEFGKSITYQSLVKICKTIPTIRKMYIWETGMITIGYGKMGSNIMNLTNTGLRFPIAYNFDIDDGFFIMGSEKPVPPELNKKYREWVKRNYEGFVLKNN